MQLLSNLQGQTAGVANNSGLLNNPNQMTNSDIMSGSTMASNNFNAPNPNLAALNMKGNNIQGPQSDLLKNLQNLLDM